jgi:hypothetical protein
LTGSSTARPTSRTARMPHDVFAAVAVSGESAIAIAIAIAIE